MVGGWGGPNTDVSKTIRKKLSLRVQKLVNLAFFSNLFLCGSFLMKILSFKKKKKYADVILEWSLRQNEYLMIFKSVGNKVEND